MLIHWIRNPFSSLSRYVATWTCIPGERAEKRKSENPNLHNHKTSISKSQVLTASLGLVEVFAKALVLHLCNCDKHRFYWGKEGQALKARKKMSQRCETQRIRAKILIELF